MWRGAARQRTGGEAGLPSGRGTQYASSAPSGVQFADTSSESEGDDEDIDYDSDDETIDVRGGGGAYGRRKSGLLITTLLVCMLYHGVGRDAARRCARLDWDGYLRGMPSSHFSRMFRMDYDTFMHILHAVFLRNDRPSWRLRRACVGER